MWKTFIMLDLQCRKCWFFYEEKIIIENNKKCPKCWYNEFNKQT